MQTYTSDFTNKTYEVHDFIRLVERRLRKDWKATLRPALRHYALYDDGTQATQVLKKLLSTYYKAYASVLLLQPGQLLPANYILLTSDCLETYVAKRLDIFLKGSSLDVLSQQAPLRTITYQERKQLATLWQLTGKDDYVEHEFITSLQTQYSQTKPSLLKSFQFLEQTVNFSKNTTTNT